MRKIFFLSFAISCLSLFSQNPPQLINYQGIARDAAGNPMLGQSINLVFNIYQSPSGGTAIYTEPTTVVSNSVTGVFTHQIGSIVSLTSVVWANGPYYMEVTINGNPLNRQQLLSVPYALYAPPPAVSYSGSVLSVGGNTVSITATPSNLNGDVTGPIGSNTISSIQNIPVNAPSPSSGQVLSYNGSAWVPNTPPAAPVFSGNVIGPANSNTIVVLRNTPLSAINPTIGQSLMYDGSSWTPGSLTSMSLSGDVVGTTSLNTVVKLQNYSVSPSAPAAGQALVYSGSQWTSSNVATPSLGITGGSIITLGSPSNSITIPAASNYWSLNGNTLVPTSTAYSVGIGNPSPAAQLDVQSSGMAISAVGASTNTAFTTKNIGAGNAIVANSGSGSAGVFQNNSAMYSTIYANALGSNYALTLNASGTGGALFSYFTSTLANTYINNGGTGDGIQVMSNSGKAINANSNSSFATINVNNGSSGSAIYAQNSNGSSPTIYANNSGTGGYALQLNGSSGSAALFSSFTSTAINTYINNGGSGDGINVFSQGGRSIYASSFGYSTTALFEKAGSATGNVVQVVNSNPSNSFEALNISTNNSAASVKASNTAASGPVSLLIDEGHIKAFASAMPTTTIGNGFGSSFSIASYSLMNGSNDVRGQATLNMALTPTIAAGEYHAIQINYTKAYNSAPFVSLTPLSTMTNGLRYYVYNSTNVGFQIMIYNANTTALNVSVLNPVYAFSYFVIE
ncbi:MAG: hypothetical protein JSU07_05650 [Bacteroidetes bacterium]|nr:hypothetical protein [Bacteroidota bacterium]